MKMPIVRLLPVCFFLTLPVTSFAAEISVDSTTLVRFEQRDVSGSSKQNLVPATQFLGLDADKLADGNLSLHFYGWGRYDLADKSFNDDRGDGGFTYGYLQYRFNKANAEIRAGRFFVHEGIVNEQVDGVTARTDLPFGFGVSAFGGATVHTSHLFGENSDGKGDGLFGGRASYRYKGMLELGLSGVYEGTAPTMTRFTNGTHRLLGGDVWLSPYRMVELMGHTSYNPVTKGVAEHSYLLNLKPISHLTLSGEFNEHREGSFLNSSALFTKMPSFNPADRLRSTGASASYEISRSIAASIDYKHFSREIGTADRFGADLKLSLLHSMFRSGLGYHYLRADQGFAITAAPGDSSTASYHELRCYALYDTKTYFATLDVIDYIFKGTVKNEKSAWEASASLGYHITPNLAASGDISYGKNPDFVDETKGLLRLTYNMSFKSKGEK
jgi:hypothetical protein